MNLNTTDKASIQQRMYQQAAEIYRQYLGRDISSLEMFDPLVLMVINACASEFQLFSEEISFAKTRMLKHLAKMLTPESYIGPRPAHGVIHAPVSESGEATDRMKDSFFYTNPQNKKIYFTPIADFSLTRAQVSYMAVGNSIYGLTDGLNKQEVLSTTDSKSLPVNSIWLGVKVASPMQKVNSLSLYFDAPLSTYVNRLPALLNTSKSFYGGQALKTSAGLGKVNRNGSNSLAFNAILQHEDEVMRFYQGRFLMLEIPAEETLQMKAKELPDEFKKCFLEDQLSKQFNGEILHWIRVDFSQSLFDNKKEVQTFLRQLISQTNCFPVMNYLVQSKSFALNEKINLFPLKCGEAYFYGVEEVKSSKSGSKHYTEQSFSQFLEEDTVAARQQTMVYALRRSAVQRFDTRTSVEWMENILQLIREESLVYNALGKNILTHNLKTIQKSVNDINAKLYQTKAEVGNEEQMFIALPKVDQSEYVVVRYWATNGVKGRNIPGGEPLKLSDSTRGVYDESAIRLLTTTIDGRNPVNEKDSLEEFRSAILVKDKIVTKEDIRQYCTQEFNQEIISCQVGKNSRIAAGKNEGFQRIITVKLELDEVTSPEHRAYIENKLSTELNARCSGILPIVVTS